jgi:aryl-alcohol dehydrogenase-like predicted oxidoreductase
MEQRTLGRTGRTVSVVGLGTWQLGADWGDVSEADARAVLEASVEAGVTFFDTADVYGDGRSETVIGGFLADHPDAGVTVATKMGRRVDQLPENYVLDNFRAWTERSRRNLGVDTLDLVQLHCPPTAVYTDDELYDALDTLVEEGAVAAYGVSVEKVEEALAAIARPHVATVQIIANAFRLKPLDEVFPAAAAAGVGIIVRVPLASGLLSGKYDETTTFAEDDHRSFNRDGSAFDVGETFSGVDYGTGLKAAQEFGQLVREHAPEGTSSAQAAIAWLWQHDAVSSVIPGARNVEQARSNAAAGEVAALGAAFDEGVHRIYDTHLRADIHPRW